MADRIHDDGANDDLVVADLGRYWLLYKFPTDEEAKLAWERLHTETQYLSVWRTRYPVQPPHTVFELWILGEAKEGLESAALICRDMGGEPHEPGNIDMIRSLRYRRQDQAIEAIAAGRGESKFHTRSERGWRIDRQGRRHPV